jgi:hypothetical protein
MFVCSEAASALTAISNSPARTTHRPSSMPTTPYSPYDPSDFGSRMGSARRIHLKTPHSINLQGTPLMPDARSALKTPCDLPHEMLPSTPAQAMMDKEDKMVGVALLSLQQKPPVFKKLTLEGEEEMHKQAALGYARPVSSTINGLYPGPMAIDPQDPGPLPILASAPSQMNTTPRTTTHLNPKTPQSQLVTQRKVLKRSAPSSSQEEDEEGENNQDAPGDDAAKPCKCKRSKCLKLYCDCFGADRYCGDQCTCEGCYNTGRPEHEATRKEAVNQTLERNPNAFSSKIMATPDSVQHATGCKCKRSGCLKKYCECFANGVRCAEHCKCSGCENYAGSPLLEQKEGSPATAPVQTARPGTTSSSKKKKLVEKPPSPRKSVRQSGLRRIGEIGAADDDEDVIPDFSAGENQRNGNKTSSTSTPVRRGLNGLAYSSHTESNLDSQSSALANFDLDLVGENTLEMVAEHSLEAAFYSSQESKGSLSSKPKPEATIAWGVDMQLPESLTRRCFEYLSTRELINVACVSVGFAEVATSPHLWDFNTQSQHTTQ